MSSAWPLVRLADVVIINPDTIKVGGPERRFRYVDIGSVSGGSIDWHGTSVVSTANAPSRARRRIVSGDVVFGTVRPQLRSHGLVRARPGEELVASTGFAVLRATAAYDSRFLCHVVLGSSIWYDARRAEVGSNYPAVTERDVGRFRVPLPPLAEQRRIAKVLDTMDESIRSTERLVAKQSQLKSGLSATLLARDENWRSVRLAELLLENPKNGYSPKEVDYYTGTIMLGLGCLTASGFEPRQLKNAPLGDHGLARAVLSDGDLLMSRANTRDLVGLVGRFRDVGHRCVYPDLMMRLRCRDAVHEDFLELLLRAPSARRQIQALAVGTSESMVKISSAIVRALNFKIPSREEQNQILLRLSSCNEVLRAARLELDKLRTLKHGLMSDLLTGRVWVNVGEDVAV